MLPSGSPASNLGPQPWTTFPVTSGQPHIPSAQPLSVDRLLPSVMGCIPQAYNRSNPNINQLSSIFPASMQSVNGAYNPQVPMGYSLHPATEHVAANERSLQNAALTQPYPVQNCCSIPQNSLPYVQSVPYLTSSLLPSICNGFLNNLSQPMAAVPHHQQAALTAAAIAASSIARGGDPLRHFSPTLINQLNRRPRPSVTSKTNLYVSGLNETDSDETLKHIVESVVQPKSCKAMTVNGRCKGYGFIDCETEKEAELAMERINEYSRATGRKLSVKFAFENEKDKLNVFVQHLPRSDYTTEDLMELFKPYGVITSAKLLDSMKGPTGIGFVRFSSPTEAEKAIKMMNKKNLCLGENTKAVTCKLADKADAQRRNLTSEITRNKFTLTHNQNQCGAGMVPQSAHASALPTGHLTGLAQSGSLATQLLSSVPTFSLEVPGFANQSATPPTMSSGVMPNIVSGPSALVQLPYASAHPGAISTPCSNLPHRSSNPLIGPPPHTQVPGSVQSQYVANLVSAYLSSMDVQQAASKTVPTAVPSNRFPNSGAPVLFHTGNSIPAPGAPSDAQVNALPPNVQYALSYGQQSQQTMAAGGTTAVSPQVVWIAPTYPNAGTSSMFQNYGFAPAFQASTVDQVKANHESQRSTPGLVLQNNYQMDRTNIPTSPANTLTSVFQSLAINGPLEASRFPMDGSFLTESSRTWPYSKTARSMEDSTPNVEQGTTCVKQVVPVSYVFEGPTNVSFTDPSSREASNFITSSISTTLASLDHSKNTVCFGAVNLPTVECFPLVEVSAANSSEYEVFSEEKLSTVNGDVAALNAEKIAPNGFHADEKANKNESTVDHKQGPRSDADCVKAVPPPTSKNDLVEPTVPLTITTTCVKFPS